MDNITVWNNYLFTFLSMAGLLFLFMVLNRWLKRHGAHINLKSPLILIYIGAGVFITHYMLKYKLAGQIEALGFIAVAFGIIKMIDIILNDIYLNKKMTPVAVPKLMRNIIIMVAYIIAFFGILKSTVGFDIAPVVTTSAVASMVIGLALQDTLTNFIAGIVLHMEKAYKVGDFIKIDGIEGMVVETTWRTTKVRQKGVGIHNIPNSMIVKQPSINFNKIEEHFAFVNFSASLDEKPNKIFEIVLDVALKTPNVIKTRNPEIRIVRIGDFAMEYELRAWIDDYDARRFVESDLMKNIWYAFKRNSIHIPYPTREVINHFAEAEEEYGDEMAQLLSRVKFFSGFDGDTINQISKKIKRKIYGKKETLFYQGDKGDSFFIIYKGKVNIIINNEVVATLKKGDFFGEMSLFTGKERAATVETVEDSEFLVLDKEGFGEILMKDIAIAEHISRVIAEREIENEKLMRESTKGSKASDAGDLKKQKGIILQLIKDFFEI